MIGIDSFKPHYEVRGKLIDPETEEVLEDRPYAITMEISDALYIATACNKYHRYPGSSFYVHFREEREV